MRRIAYPFTLALNKVNLGGQFRDGGGPKIQRL